MSKLALHLDLVPLDLAWEDIPRNLALTEEAIVSRLKANPQLPSESRLFVFPEVSLTGFVTETATEVAVERNGSEVQAFRDLAKKYRTALVIGFPEKIAGQEKPSNTLLLISPQGEDLADYQKIHLYTAGPTPESATYERGSVGTIVDYRGWKLGFGICFDLRFPELFQVYAREGVELVILPACWIGGPGKARQFEVLSAARAIEGQFFFGSLNRSGKDPHCSFEGDVWCFSPKGEPLAEVSRGGGFSLNPEMLVDAKKLQVRNSDLEEYRTVIVD
jgi:omega-amidase